MSSSHESIEIRKQSVGKNDADLSGIVQENISDVENEFLDLDETSEDVIEHYRAIKKREAQWKAFGFDSKALQIPDSWASRNLWFQQLTHSVRFNFRGGTGTVGFCMSIFCIIMVVIISNQ